MYKRDHIWIGKRCRLNEISYFVYRGKVRTRGFVLKQKKKKWQTCDFYNRIDAI